MGDPAKSENAAVTWDEVLVAAEAGAKALDELEAHLERHIAPVKNPDRQMPVFAGLKPYANCGRRGMGLSHETTHRAGRTGGERMKPTPNRALAEQQALVEKLRRYLLRHRGDLLLREAIASVRLSRVEDGTKDRDDESEEPRDGR